MRLWIPKPELDVFDMDNVVASLMQAPVGTAGDRSKVVPSDQDGPRPEAVTIAAMGGRDFPGNAHAVNGEPCLGLAQARCAALVEGKAGDCSEQCDLFAAGAFLYSAVAGGCVASSGRHAHSEL